MKTELLRSLNSLEAGCLESMCRQFRRASADPKAPFEPEEITSSLDEAILILQRKKARLEQIGRELGAMLAEQFDPGDGSAWALPDDGDQNAEDGAFEDSGRKSAV